MYFEEWIKLLLEWLVMVVLLPKADHHILILSAYR